MSFLERFKEVNRKWMWLLIVLIALCIGGGIVEDVGERHEGKPNQSYAAVLNGVCQDLLYLNTNEGFKLTGEQAKAMLPLIGGLKSATSESTQLDIAQKIYTILTPQQYQALLQKDSLKNETRGSQSGIRGGAHYGGKEHSWEHEDFEGNAGAWGEAREAALSNVVTKMLKDKAAEAPAQTQPGV